MCLDQVRFLLDCCLLFTAAEVEKSPRSDSPDSQTTRSPTLKKAVILIDLDQAAHLIKLIDKPIPNVEVHLFAGPTYPDQKITYANFHRTERRITDASDYELAFFAFKKLFEKGFVDKIVYIYSCDRALDNVCQLLQENGVESVMLSRVSLLQTVLERYTE
ncbi:hypothetical protein K493DRAFT_308675 [Basidiobolus meristosporus CBS 931.73]|uniref:NYN domain-containing protein n=1 Tax=Basidiobolus meristosporus CBS 931.73 TaxID=1314790 RepID=A0A1Y1WYX1_9FUNG|nr:hypothetical protein K493DRAFT_308675 [Basidiobolus meristosporus CBS 931.73]|eukprot:ORX78595.1 hypothetical protein K493DRAFT_308675 [Basidiobolus meristosporus CBS 931.73]